RTGATAEGRGTKITRLSTYPLLNSSVGWSVEASRQENRSGAVHHTGVCPGVVVCLRCMAGPHRFPVRHLLRLSFGRARRKTAKTSARFTQCGDYRGVYDIRGQPGAGDGVGRAAGHSGGTKPLAEVSATGRTNQRRTNHPSGRHAAWLE